MCDERVRTPEDRDELRAALAPRLLELGNTKLAMNCASRLSSDTCAHAHASMLMHLQDVELAAPYARVILNSDAPEASAFAVARELRTLGSRVPREVAYRLVASLIAHAESEPQLFLLLTAFAETIVELGGPEAARQLATASS